MTQVDEGPESPGTPGVLTTFGTPTVGEVLAERYELQEHINDDSFGRQVWRGIDVILRRPVAVVMRYPGGEAAVEMLDAAVAASRVVHPHLVDVYDAIDEGTRAYVVREWVDGGALREYVTDGPLDADRATSVASAIASALAAIHATGMVHGNIHPGTVLIGSDGRVVLSDARADEAVTPDTDVRTVGAVLYCALTGHWPHAEVGAAALPDAVRDESGAITPPRQVRAGIPGHLSDLATDLLDPAIAPPSADVLAADLGRLDGEREESYFSVGSPLDFDQPGGYPPATAQEPPRSVRKLVIGVAVLLILSLVGLLLTINALSGRHGAAPVVPPPAGAAPSSGAQANPAPIPIAASQVRVVDPDGNRQELSGVSKAFDDDPNSAWSSNHYYASGPNFGGIKRGMGILIDLGSAKQVAAVRVTATPGATIELRSGTDDPGADSGAQGDKQVLDSYAPGQPKVTGPGTTVLNGPQQPVRYLLVWITKLPSTPDTNGGYIVQVQDIKVLAS